MKLALGTVQFGLDYGVANTEGQVNRDAAAAILSMAQRAGIDTLDTAIAYGDAEVTLGAVAQGGWRIVTKLPPLPMAVANPAAWALSQVNGSLERLGRPAVDAVLLHRAQDLREAGGQALWRGLQDLKTAGLCRRVGISIYSPEDLDALPVDMVLDLVQSPFNPLDRRLETSGWDERLAAAGTSIHLRSAFLQGALLMPAEARDARLPPGAFAAWDAFLKETGQTGLQAALGLSMSRPWSERVVVGVQSPEQLQDILDAAEAPGEAPPATLATNDPAVIDPRRWRRA